MNIGVFCASSDSIEATYGYDALKLGVEIGKRSWSLVYGGTNCGLMREVADATIANGGKAIGIIPECIRDRGVTAVNVSELWIASDMKERKQMLRDQSDVFIALPGGWGTLEEITEVITLKQLGFHNKPIIFINTNGFYTLFFRFIQNIREQGFISAAYNKLYVVVDTIEEALDYIDNYTVKEIVPKYNNLPSASLI